MAIPEIDVDELHRRFVAGTLLVDVRESDEFAGARVSGARSIPLGEVPARVAEIPTEGPVMLICGKGGRSMAAAGFLGSQGFDVVNVLGGTEAWVAGGFPVESGPAT